MAGALCPFCQKPGTSKELLVCQKCQRSYHFSCLQLPANIAQKARQYDWECNDCKRCAVCNEGEPEDPYLLLCDGCDRGYHIFCLKPPLKKLPTEEWKCKLCREGKNTPAKQNASPRKTTSANKKGSPKKSVKARKKSSEDVEMMDYESPVVDEFMDDDGDEQWESDDFSPFRASNSKPPPKKARNPKKQPPKRNARKKKFLVDSDSDVDVFMSEDDIQDTAPVAHNFGGRLTAKEASIDNTAPTKEDRRLFDAALEESLKTMPKPRNAAIDHSMNADGEIILPKIEQIIIGTYEIKTWYMAPYPEEYNLLETVYLCDFCLKYMKSRFCLERHYLKCAHRAPPGDEIYRDGKLSVFEVDGRKNKIYCQNLCLLAKMFLDHKTLYYDVEPFLFYILTEDDEHGCHFVGYFSKEKRSANNYNLSCIVTLPIFQGKGYGQFLVDFSYLLSRKEGVSGSPEKPLSDLGLLTYRSYWRNAVLGHLYDMYKQHDQETQVTDSVSIDDISTHTGLTHDDIITTMQDLNLLKRKEQGKYEIHIDLSWLRTTMEKVDKKGYPRAKPELLHWTPFILSKRNHV